MDEKNKTFCFAYIDDNNCAALAKKECEGCRLYKNRILENDPNTKYLIEKTKEEIKRNKERKNV